MTVSRRAFTAAAAVLAAPAMRRAGAAEPIRLRCSLDTAPSHLRNVSITDYLKRVEQASGGQIRGEVFHSGALFPDLDVAKALVQGQVEMACPGTWTISGIIPEAELFQLPPMYGRTLEQAHKVVDGRVGRLVADRIAQKLRCEVLGPWFDLGLHNWYSAGKPLGGLADIRGMKIRNSGGAGQAWRTRFFGGIPNTTAWPNVPLALSQGTFDGLISTNQSLASSKLWEAGVKFALFDRAFVGEYVPMVSHIFWGKLPADLQKVMTETWAQHIQEYRAGMAKAQDEARRTLVEHGVKFTDVSDQEIDAVRAKMLPETDRLAKEMKISPEVVKMVAADVGSA